MKDIVARALEGLPSFVGVVFGVLAYSKGCPWTELCGAFVLLGVIALVAGRLLMWKSLEMGTLLLECWILLSIGILALATICLISLNLGALKVWLQSEGSSETTSVLSGALVGALATFAASIWSTCVDKLGGFLSPSYQFKMGISRVYYSLPNPPVGENAVFHAVFQDVVVGFGELGWGFKARRLRAKILAAEVKRQRDQ